jgi:N-acetylmuramoyl-L-alanine amidase
MKKLLVNRLFATTLSVVSVVLSVGIAIDPTIPSHAQAPTPTATPTVTPSIRPPFRDIIGDTYFEEINIAAGTGIGTTSGFIAGFGDGTFRPLLPLTREQLVSMVLAGIAGNIGTGAGGSNQLTSRPYTDVETSRWSAANIQWAKNNKIVTGYGDGSFRPDQPITRAELIAVQRRAAEYALSLPGSTLQINPRQTPINFTDMNGHWAASLVSQMSGYCKVASPLNEVGTAFAPNAPSQRNYGVAATVRMITCVRQALDFRQFIPSPN